MNCEKNGVGFVIATSETFIDKYFRYSSAYDPTPVKFELYISHAKVLVIKENYLILILR